MSQDNQGLQLPGVADAENVIFERVFSEAFFGKLASLGHQPATQKEAMELLELGNMLAQVEDAPAQSGTYSQIKSAVAKVLDSSNTVVSAEHRAKQAAYAIAHDPDVYASVLSLKVAEAQQAAN